jgi:hypothetical protein
MFMKQTSIFKYEGEKHRKMKKGGGEEAQAGVMEGVKIIRCCIQYQCTIT